MVDPAQEFEITDIEGDTIQINGVAPVSEQSYPSVAGDIITEFSIWSDIENDDDDRFEIRWGAMASGRTITCGSSFQWTPKGRITQIKIKRVQGAPLFELTINRTR